MPYKPNAIYPQSIIQTSFSFGCLFKTSFNWHNHINHSVKILRLVEMIVNKGVGVADAGRLILYLLPSILVLTIPMAVLLGCLVAFGRMSADNEITALKSGGYSLQRLTVPVLFFSVAIGFLTVYLIGVARAATLHGHAQKICSEQLLVARLSALVGL